MRGRAGRIAEIGTVSGEAEGVSTPRRWEPRVAKARTPLVRRGWLVGSCRGSDWELTGLGRQRASSRRLTTRAIDCGVVDGVTR